MPNGPLVFVDAYVEVDGIDLSNRVLSVTLNINVDLPESTAMGDGFRTRLPGLKDWNVEVEFKNDFAVGNVDEIIHDLIGSSTFPIKIRPVRIDAVGTNNPSYEGQVLVETHQPIGGAVGELARSSVTFQGAGTLNRITA